MTIAVTKGGNKYLSNHKTSTICTRLLCDKTGFGVFFRLVSAWSPYWNFKWLFHAYLRFYLYLYSFASAMTRSLHLRPDVEQFLIRQLCICAVAATERRWFYLSARSRSGVHAVAPTVSSTSEAEKSSYDFFCVCLTQNPWKKKWRIVLSDNVKLCFWTDQKTRKETIVG
jgi:hypothetical protein